MLFLISARNISHKLLRPSQFLKKFMEIAEINQDLMLQHIGRVATTKIVSRSCLRCLQTTLIMGVGDWSQNLCEVFRVEIFLFSTRVKVFKSQKSFKPR